MGEDAGALDAARAADEHERGGGAHVLRVGAVAGEAQRDVGLDRRGQLAGAVVEVRPRPVRTLLGSGSRPRIEPS